MATRLLVARTVRRSAPVIGFGLTSSALLVAHNQRPTRFDHISASAPLTQEYSTKRPERKDYLDTEIIRQLSGGSVSGFITGLLVSTFSKTLVLLAGISLVILQLSSSYASRFGINLTQKLRNRIPPSSRILTALNFHAAFKLSFAIAFAMSAFMSF
ncbi:hypothetical protein QBC42DRAFT_267647 [Cladorrhinum samala]|uniref:Fun14 family protein n=1 Tax=Cladorrhinum samala TaxID=585594 RepID=A0AAV9HP03_9PEZI|nr:hypothetical protein QBC42DRAFT_267647 [Cladorrhinum samala]